MCFHSKKRLINGKGFAHLEATLINKISVKIVKARRTELNGGLFRINTVFKAHNSHSQEQQIVKCSFAIKISTPKACHKFFFAFLQDSCSANHIFNIMRERDNNSDLSLSQIRYTNFIAYYEI